MNILIKEKINYLNSLYLEFKNLYQNIIFDKKKEDYYKKIKFINLIINEINNLNLIEQEIKSLNDLLDDEEFSSIAKLEIKQKKILISKIEKKILNFFINKNDKNCILEIRAGIGGRESCIFIKDLYNLYIKYANLNNWNCEILNFSAENNGYKYLILKFIGNNAFNKLRFESGCHRVQRVPQTENQGRVHTSTCLVAVLSENFFKKLPNIDLENIRIDTFKSSGAGGQHVNTTDSAVRIKHLPSGITVECQDERSQHKNKEKALNVLKIRLKNYEESKIKSDINIEKKKIFDYSDRCFKNRTYNFVQDRVTDHRINLSFSLSNLIENGNLNFIHDKLFEVDIIKNLDFYIQFINDLLYKK